MPTDTAPIKTTIRIPPRIHAGLESAADAAGLTLNAEMLVRLQHDPRDNYAKAILEEINRRDATMMAVMWKALDRADGVLERVAAAMSLVTGEGDVAALKRDVEFARELINAVGAHR